MKEFRIYTRYFLITAAILITFLLYVINKTI